MRELNHAIVLLELIFLRDLVQLLIATIYVVFYIWNGGVYLLVEDPKTGLHVFQRHITGQGK